MLLAGRLLWINFMILPTQRVDFTEMLIVSLVLLKCPPIGESFAFIPWLPFCNLMGPNYPFSSTSRKWRNHLPGPPCACRHLPGLPTCCCRHLGLTYECHCMQLHCRHPSPSPELSSITYARMKLTQIGFVVSQVTFKRLHLIFDTRLEKRLNCNNTAPVELSEPEWQSAVIAKGTFVPLHHDWNFH